MISNNIRAPYFLLILTGLCLFYLGFECFFNHYSTLSVDEFWFAHSVYQYKDQLPYRDFAPYKTILGYYLLLPTMLSARGIMQTLVLTKDALALLNTCIVFISACWLTRSFSRIGVLISVAMIVSADIVLSYSTQLRVDLFSYWFCFFSLLWLLEKRYLFAGILLGLGFATSQKAIWYIFASNCALGFVWLTHDRHLKNLKSLVLLNLSCACIICIYLTFWAWVADWNTVLNSVFVEASAMYQLDWYNSARELFWKSIILYNPLLFLLWPVTLLSLLITYDNDIRYQSRLFVSIYAYVILFCLIPYKQVFPYYMQVTIPIFLALYAAFASWIFDLFSQQGVIKTLVNKTSLWCLLILYNLTLLFIILLLQLPKSYLLVGCIPFAIICYVTQSPSSQQKMLSPFFKLIIITATCIALIYPVGFLPSKLLYLDGSYQQAHIQVIDSLLEDGSEYVAGIDFIYNKNQPIAGLRHLMGPAIDYLYAPTPKLKTVMLASLNEDPNATISSVISALKQSSVKFYVNNYRMHALPKAIKEYLDSQYAHWWGSIYLYAPRIEKNNHHIALKFSGDYLIDANSNEPIQLNNHIYFHGAIVSLKKGDLLSNTNCDYRLKLIPKTMPLMLDLDFKQDNWGRVIF